MNKPQHIIVHHSVTPQSLPRLKAERSFNNTHKTRFNFKSTLGWYIGYHYVIYGSGEVRQYRKDNEDGAHCKEQRMNTRSIGICLSGNFDVEQPNIEQIAALQTLLVTKTQEFKISAEKIFPHRKFAPYKSCYGTLLADDWARNLFLMKRS